MYFIEVNIVLLYCAFDRHLQFKSCNILRHLQFKSCNILERKKGKRKSLYLSVVLSLAAMSYSEKDNVFY